MSGNPVEKPTLLWGAKAVLRETFARIKPHRLGPDPSTFSAAENVGKPQQTGGQAGKPASN